MKKIIYIIIALITVVGIGFILFNNKDTKNISQCANDNTLPMYGCSSYEEYINSRTPKQKEADEFLISSITAQYGNDVVVSSNAANKKGWDLVKTDIVTARKRFNQAWLIDHNNFVTFWQFAITYAQENKNDLALADFERAVSLYDKKYETAKDDFTTLICDRALSYLANASIEKDKVRQKELLNKILVSIENQSKLTGSINSQCLLTEAQAYGALNDNVNAKNKVNEALKLEPSLKNSEIVSEIVKEYKLSL
jgi:Tfp pilus assembly protein PilF